MDRIWILDLPVRCRIGVPAEERANPQELRLDAALEFDTRPSAMDDDFLKTIDYAAVTKRILQVASDRDRRLIETLAEEIAAAILEDFSVEAVSLTLRKPTALADFGAKAAGLEIRRTRHG